MSQIPKQTLRDEIALKMLQAVIISTGYGGTPDELVSTAYEIADAIIQRMKDNSP